MKTYLIFIFSLSISCILHAQPQNFNPSSYNIQFQNEIIRVEENITSFQWDKMPNSSEFQNGYYGWIQFHETPNQSVQDDFKSKGLRLIEYIPNKTYLFYFPKNTSLEYLKTKGARAILPIKYQYKLSTELKQSISNQDTDDELISVMIKFQKNAFYADIIEELSNHNIEITQIFKGQNIIELSIPISSVEPIADLSFVKWMELSSPEDIEFDNRGRGLQRSNSIDTQSPMGRNYTGEGIGVMVRDFGSIGPVPHIDFQGRLTELNSDVNPFNHGDGVAGVFAGAGNLDPTMRGAAAGATIYNVNRSQTFLDAETTSLINSGTVQITNTSSGFNCANEYTLNAVTVDQQARDLPSLLHVMSAGNTNSADCGYGAGPEWSNLGGANKTGKNIIAVGNTNFDGSIVANSSRGPAADGRIKPDIAAMGNGQFSTDENNEYFLFGGTSASSPSTAGAAAQLYQAYRDLNGGEIPQSGLIKATLLNTASEAGNIGPDYTYGWGIVNTLSAVKVLENNTFLSDEISQGNTNNHSVTIPPNATQVRFMVYWTDVPGADGANPALVNDLDLVVNDPANNTLLPWILDHTPDPVALNTPATNGVDHLNNMEQVLINNPAEGDYTLDISGFNVPVGPQEYFVVYHITLDNIDVTYPNGGESFVPGEMETIHWDATNTTEDFNLEYSTDAGSTWTAITTVPSNNRNYPWQVPNSLKGNALIRVSSGSFSDMSDASFSAVEQVEGFEFSQICPDGTTFVWEPLEGAESYDVYLLGEKFMEVAGNSTTTSITVPVLDPTKEIWAAIVAKNNTENWSSRRTVAINNPGGFLDCSLSSDIGISQILNDPNDFSTPCSNTENIIVSTLITNSGTDAQSNFDMSYQLNEEDIVSETYSGTLMPGEQVIYDFETTMTIPSEDEYTLTVTSGLTGDQNQFNDKLELNFVVSFSGTALDFIEDFEENGLSPLGWSIVNPDNAVTWVEINGVIGSDGNTTNAAYLNNWEYDASGQEDYIITEYFNLLDVNEGVTLRFDLAKAQWNEALNDGLRVEVSIDCGDSYISVYEKSGLELSTLPDYNITDAWQPLSAADWRTEEIDLSSFGGQSIQIRFVNINGWANSTFIDNIILSKTLVSTIEELLSRFNLFPNPASQTLHLTLSTQNKADATMMITNNLGQTIVNKQWNGNAQTTLDISEYSPGIYFVTIVSDGTAETKKLIIE